MRIREKLIGAGLAGGAWFVSWAFLSLGLAIGLAGEPNPTLAVRVLWYGGASGILFGALAFLGWWQALPLWFRGTLYGLLAAAPVVLGVILLLGLRRGTLDWWYLTGAAMLSGLFGYFAREMLTD